MDRSTQHSDQRHAVITVAICFLIAVIEGLDIQAAGIAAAGIREHFGLDSSQLGVFFSAGILGLLPGALVGGRFADRIGRKKVLIWSTAVFALFTLCTVWVNSFESYWRCVLGRCGFRAAMPILITLASEAVCTKPWWCCGLNVCGMPVGAAILSLMASTDFGSNWKNIFYLGGLLPFIVIPLMMWLLPESREFLKAQAAGKDVTAQMLRQKHLLKICLIHKTYLRTFIYLGELLLTLMVVYIMLSWLAHLYLWNQVSRVKKAVLHSSISMVRCDSRNCNFGVC